MTVKLKNIRPGVLIIADVKLRLDPGQAFETESISPQMESALSAGRLARMDGNDDPRKQDESPPTGIQEEDLLTHRSRGYLPDHRRRSHAQSPPGG